MCLLLANFIDSLDLEDGTFSFLGPSCFLIESLNMLYINVFNTKKDRRMLEKGDWISKLTKNSVQRKQLLLTWDVQFWMKCSRDKHHQLRHWKNIRGREVLKNWMKLAEECADLCKLFTMVHFASFVCSSDFACNFHEIITNTVDGCYL